MEASPDRLRRARRSVLDRGCGRVRGVGSVMVTCPDCDTYFYLKEDDEEYPNFLILCPECGHEFDPEGEQ